MSDPIQIPRAAAVHMRDALRGIVDAADDDCGEEKCRDCAPVRVMRAALAALDAALAEPERHVSLVCPQCHWTLQEPEKERAEVAAPARGVAGAGQTNALTGEAYRTPEPDATREPVAKAWAEGYRQGVQDERTSEASIGIAGFGAKVEPARQNPYAALFVPEPEAKREPATDAEIVIAGDEHARDPEYLLDFRDGFRAAERFHGIRKEDGK